MKLLIISHTVHYYRNNELVGWSPTVMEINHLLDIFDEIFHIAVLSDEKAPDSTIAYNSEKIHFLPLKKVGGKSLKNKCDVIFQIPKVVSLVRKTLPLVDYFQLRTPTAMAVYLIPYLTLCTIKKGWYKYAGNWVEEGGSISFRFQRWLLKNQTRKVTINGKWNDQKKHCITFENPCLTSANRSQAQDFVQSKRVHAPFNFCFVGTFYKRKGIDKILEALDKIDAEVVGHFYFVGNGGEVELYKKKSGKLNFSVEFCGFLAKNEINSIYKKSHFIILPSDNEGFPKVISEAMNFGCIPIVSNVSCIGQYIKHGINGYLIDPNTSEVLKEILLVLPEISEEHFQKMLKNNYELVEVFTYEHYNNQISATILDVKN
jgi:glycosyltransferase involved in cell wall biosynthesis